MLFLRSLFSELVMLSVICQRPPCPMAEGEAVSVEFANCVPKRLYAWLCFVFSLNVFSSFTVCHQATITMHTGAALLNSVVIIITINYSYKALYKHLMTKTTRTKTTTTTTTKNNIKIHLYILLHQANFQMFFAFGE